MGAIIFGLEAPDVHDIDRTIGITKQLINAGVDSQDGAIALCKAIALWRTGTRKLKSCSERYRPIAAALLNNGADIGGPFGSAVTNFITSSLDLETTQSIYESIAGQWRSTWRSDDWRHHANLLPPARHKGLLIFCIMQLSYRPIEVLLEVAVKAGNVDAVTLSQSLAATFMPLPMKGYADSKLRLGSVVQTMMNLTRPDDTIYDENLHGDLLMQAMKQFVNSQYSCKMNVLVIKKTLEALRTEERQKCDSKEEN